MVNSAVKNRWIVGGLAAALVIAGGVVAVRIADSADSAADCSRLQGSTAEAAATLASECGAEVEVLSERSPWVSVYARPDGKSRMTIDAVPDRTDVNGDWEPIDTDVLSEQQEPAALGMGGGGGPGAGVSMSRVALEDVSVPPDVAGMLPVTAPVYPMWFNPGGEAGDGLPIGVIERDGSWVKLWFPLALPTPTIDGRFVTYQLADDVKVVVSVESDGSGFRPIVELGSPAGAQWFQDALDGARAADALPGTGWQIPYRVEGSTDLTLHDTGGTGFELLDAEGTVAFSAPPSFMWDSSADEAVEGGGADRIEFPLPGDRTAQMPVGVTDAAGGNGVVVVSPDESMLTSADTVWPVRIDPTIAGRIPVEWVAVRTGGYTSPLYKWTDTTTRMGESMGYCSTSWSNECVTTFTSRLVWEFGGLSNWLAPLDGADIDEASFSADPGGWGSCTSTRTDLYRTSLIDTSSPSWGDISWAGYLSNVVAPQGDDCAGDDGVRREWSVLASMQSAAAGDLSTVAFGLRANSEASSSSYKTYKSNAQLSFTYNRPPNVPTYLKMADPAYSCVAGANRPVIAEWPTFAAYVSDPDGGDSVQTQFQVLNLEGTLVWGSGLMAPVASGSSVQVTVPAGELVPAKSYQYRVRASDGEKLSAWTTSSCEFHFDNRTPAKPIITPVRVDVDAIYDTGVERGGIGIGGAFRLSRGDGDLNTTSFRYSFNSTAYNLTAIPNAYGWVEIPYAPTTELPQTLRVKAYSDAEVPSAVATYTFEIASAKEDGIWTFDEGAGTTAADTSGVETPQMMTVPGTAQNWVDGPHELFQSRQGDHALWFDGVNDYAFANPVVDTRNSFAVSAFVWLDAAKLGTNTFTAVSQDGVTQSGFAISYVPTCAGSSTGCWSFGMPSSDITAATTTTVNSAIPATGDPWVHLVAAHDATAKTMTLWACNIGTPTSPGDGNPAKSSAARTATPWLATGALAVGRGLTNGAPSKWWPGRVDNLRIFSGEIVAEAAIRRICQGAEATDFSTGLDALDPTINTGE